MKKRILVIDDNHVIRDLLNNFFTLNGYVVQEQGECQSLLNAQDELFNFDVLIIDYDMPMINGADFVKKIRHLYPQLLIIGMSSFEEASKYFLEAGVNFFLLKPFNIFEILNIINKYTKNT